ncbi:sodium:solute symporter family transporter [Janibacter corallicola]|uniref:sodium:solute symporter family transporter n=1 Tax=Janibacter corallicola TaxID=415212 RepID=UPI00082DDC8B|nr:hypothetical protein [Janibacter corallicola]
MNTTIVGIAGAYLLVVLLIGLWATRHTKDSGDFYIAGRSLGVLVMAIAVFSSIQSGFGVVGGTSTVTDGGYGFVSGVMIATPLGFALTWLMIGKRMMGVGDMGEMYTVGDVAELRYKSPMARGVMGLTVALGVLGYLGTQVLAMGIVVAAIFDVSATTGALIGMAVLGLYVIGGGILAGVYTDLFQGVLMLVVSFVAFYYALQSGGGIASMTRTLQAEAPDLVTPFGLSPWVTIPCWIFLFSLGGSAQPHGLTKFLMLKERSSLRWGPLISGTGYAITTLMVLGIGSAVSVLTLRGDFPKMASPDESFTRYLTDFTPPVVAGLVIAGLLAAIMSTGSSFLTLGAASAVRDIPRAFNLTVRRELLWSRVAVAALLVLSTGFALYIGSVVALLGTFGWGTFAASLFPALVLGMMWQGGTKEAAISSALIGIVLNFVLEVGAKYGWAPLPEGVVVGAFTFAVTLIIYIGVSLATRGRSEGPEAPLASVIEGGAVTASTPVSQSV